METINQGNAMASPTQPAVSVPQISEPQPIVSTEAAEAADLVKPLREHSSIPQLFNKKPRQWATGAIIGARNWRFQRAVQSVLQQLRESKRLQHKRKASRLSNLVAQAVAMSNAAMAAMDTASPQKAPTVGLQEMEMPTGHMLFGAEFHLEEKIQIFRICAIPIEDRRDDDVEALATLLRNAPFFSSMSQQDLIALARGMTLESYPAGSVVFSQGQLAEQFYVVLSGSVEVQVTRPTGLRYVACVLGPGKSFGEAQGEELEKRKRQATVCAKEDTVLAVLSSEVNSVVVRMREHENRKRALFLTRGLRVPLFRDTPSETLLTISTKMVSKSFSAGNILCVQDKPCVSLFFIVRGTCRVLKTMKLPSEQRSGKGAGRRTMSDEILQLETLKEGDIFGGIPSDAASPQNTMTLPARFSVLTEGEVECLVVPCQDFYDLCDNVVVEALVDYTQGIDVTEEQALQTVTRGEGWSSFKANLQKGVVLDASLKKWDHTSVSSGFRDLPSVEKPQPSSVPSWIQEEEDERREWREAVERDSVLPSVKKREVQEAATRMKQHAASERTLTKRALKPTSSMRALHNATTYEGFVPVSSDAGLAPCEPLSLTELTALHQRVVAEKRASQSRIQFAKLDDIQLEEDEETRRQKERERNRERSKQRERERISLLEPTGAIRWPTTLVDEDNQDSDRITISDAGDSELHT